MNFIMAVIMMYVVLSVVRIVKGPTIWDRLMGLNLVSSKLLVLIVLVASGKGLNYLLDIGIVYSLLGFFGITFMAFYI